MSIHFRIRSMHPRWCYIQPCYLLFVIRYEANEWYVLAWTHSLTGTPCTSKANNHQHKDRTMLNFTGKDVFASGFREPSYAQGMRSRDHFTRRLPIEVDFTFHSVMEKHTLFKAMHHWEESIQTTTKTTINNKPRT